MLFKKKKPERLSYNYDSKNEKPILKCSICNGEQVAGFKNIHTGIFHEVLFVRDDADLQRFMEQYGLTEIPKEY